MQEPLYFGDVVKESGATDKVPTNQPISAMNGTGQVSNGNHFVHVEGGLDYGSISTSTYQMDSYYPKTVVDTVVDDETITITYVQRARFTYTTYNSHVTIGGPQPVHYNPDKVFKEVYGCVNGKLTLVKTIEGRIVPPQLEETYDFDE